MQSARFTTFVAPLACALGLLFGSSAEAGSYEETVEAVYTLPADGRLELYNANGSVEVRAGEGREVRLEATKRVSALTRSRAERAFEKTEVRVEEKADGLYIETRDGPGATGLLDWFFGHGGVEVRYVLEVPLEATLDLYTVNGAIQVEAVAGHLRARTTNGRIVLEDLRGSAEVRTTNGAVRADFSTLPADADLRLTTINGGISVRLPADWRGEVDARTVHGRVRSELELEEEIRGRRGNRLRGRSGENGGRLEARTTNGGIRLTRSG